MTEFMFYDLTSWHTNYYEIVGLLVQWIGFMFIILADTNKGTIDNVNVLCFNIRGLSGFIFEPSLI